MRSITMSEKHGKICDNMKTESKIFHARINLVSDKLEKTVKITSLQLLRRFQIFRSTWQWTPGLIKKTKISGGRPVLSEVAEITAIRNNS